MGHGRGRLGGLCGAEMSVEWRRREEVFAAEPWGEFEISYLSFYFLSVIAIYFSLKVFVKCLGGHFWSTWLPLTKQQLCGSPSPLWCRWVALHSQITANCLKQTLSLSVCWQKPPPIKTQTYHLLHRTSGPLSPSKASCLTGAGHERKRLLLSYRP